MFRSPTMVFCWALLGLAIFTSIDTVLSSDHAIVKWCSNTEWLISRKLPSKLKCSKMQIHLFTSPSQIEMPWNSSSHMVSINASNACMSINASSNLVSASICMKASYSNDHLCFRMCCPKLETNLDFKGCLEEQDYETFHSVMMTNETETSFELRLDDDGGIGLLERTPDCPKYSQLVANFTNQQEEWFQIQKDYQNSCLAFISTNSTIGNGSALGILSCFPEMDDGLRTHSIIQVVLGSISCCFLLTILLVYACTSSLQNLHGKTFMCHATSLLFAYISLTINEMVALGLLKFMEDSSTNILCTCLAYVILYSYHSAFLWLNVMSFDLWWTFGGIRGNWMSVYLSNHNATVNTKSRTQRTRFIWYCCYAWGTAFLLSGGTKLADLLGSSYAPRMGFDRCWFSSLRNEIIFFIVPITMTLLINLLFFIVTAHRCAKIEAELKLSRAHDDKTNAKNLNSRKARLKLNIKLFVVMGLPWLFVSLSAYSEYYLLSDSYINKLLDFVSKVNLLQGLWFFLLFALKPKVYLKLREQICCCNWRTDDYHKNETCIEHGK